MDDEKETKVRFETLSAEKIPFGKNNLGMNPRSWLIAIIRLGEHCAGDAPKDSSNGRPRVTPAARRMVRRVVFMCGVFVV